MKFTTFAATLLTFGLGSNLVVCSPVEEAQPGLEARACCDVKVCDAANLQGNCKNGCYPYRKMTAINKSGIGSIASLKTDTDCACTYGTASNSCGTVDYKGVKQVPNHCLTGIKNVYCSPV
ncbi:hypothetical protein B0T10DRAFT_611803 [Thelonectria olida]|uniref:Uncharacterized protein n=1 Tax=Thelonectria olida TaxID=1576542 RepID=A0A9P8VNG0_9HYPO|nr:hypothetical protein B0T10DRAFT_611803 [Thelonectria olida]